MTGGSDTNVGVDPGTSTADAGADAGKEFVARVLGSNNRVWDEIFTSMNATYQKPKLVLFEGFVQSACGAAQSAMGPFYCPGDQKVYIDLSFYQDLKNKLGAPGDFAQAYVIAHEVGHHVQNLLGIADKVTQARMRASEEEANALSVRMELQADCFSGIWAQEANASAKILEEGDIEEGLNAACRHWRRPAAEAVAGLCGAGILHPWHICPAGELVQEGLRSEEPARLRHLRDQQSLTSVQQQKLHKF